MLTSCEDVIEVAVPTESPRLIIDAFIRVDTTQAITNVRVKVSETASTNKYVTQALIDKLNNIEAGAEVNTVTSVNGQIGAVSLSLDDLDDVIAAAPSGALAGKKFFLEVNGAGTDYILTERFRASAVLAEGSGLVTQTEINGGGTNYEPALLLNATIPTTGTYRVSLRFKWSLDNTSINFLSRVAWTDNTSTVTNIFEHAQESQDSGGTGETLNNISGGTISGTLGTGTDQKTAGGDETELTLAAGSHSFQFEFGLQALDGTAEAAVYSAYLVVESV